MQQLIFQVKRILDEAAAAEKTNQSKKQ